MLGSAKMTETAPVRGLVEDVVRRISLTQGFNAWLGVELLRMGDGEVEIALTLRQELTQHHGFAHGGVVGALADTACSWAAASAAGDVVTASYNIHFVAPAKGTRLVAKAAVIRAGKRQSTVEAKVFIEAPGEPPRLAAVALAAIAHVGR
jgi:uncharacterized protein (TIGR00369 family)